MLRDYYFLIEEFNNLSSKDHFAVSIMKPTLSEYFLNRLAILSVLLIFQFLKLIVLYRVRIVQLLIVFQHHTFPLNQPSIIQNHLVAIRIYHSILSLFAKLSYRYCLLDSRDFSLIPKVYSLFRIPSILILSIAIVIQY